MRGMVCFANRPARAAKPRDTNEVRGLCPLKLPFDKETENIVRSFTIDYDVFFLSRGFVDRHHQALAACLLVPFSEFLQHPAYSTVHSGSNHATWQVDCDVVLVAEEGWYEAQAPGFCRALFEESRARGSCFADGEQPITIRYWADLSDADKNRIITREDEEPAGPCPPLPPGFEHLTKYHNVFPRQHGANCFGAVLYAIGKSPFILGQWVHQQSFLLFLERAGYRETPGQDFAAEDVLCFYEKGSLVHACYAVSGSHCFNKNGQTFHEPWAITGFHAVLEDFAGFDCRAFRRLEG